MTDSRGLEEVGRRMGCYDLLRRSVTRHNEPVTTRNMAPPLMDNAFQIIHEHRQLAPLKISYGGDIDQALSEMEAEIRKLRRELARVTEHREILKKAISIFSHQPSRFTSL